MPVEREQIAGGKAGVELQFRVKLSPVMKGHVQQRAAECATLGVATYRLMHLPVAKGDLAPVEKAHDKIGRNDGIERVYGTPQSEPPTAEAIGHLTQRVKRFKPPQLASKLSVDDLVGIDIKDSIIAAEGGRMVALVPEIVEGAVEDPHGRVFGKDIERGIAATRIKRHNVVGNIDKRIEHLPQVPLAVAGQYVG